MFALLLSLAATPSLLAATYTASTEAELVTAINQANADADPSSTIRLTANIAVATPGAVPPVSKALFIDASGFTIATTGTSTLAASSPAVLTVNGTLTGVGLTKTTAGTVVLSGASVTYTKQIEVNAGALRVENGSQVTFGTSFGGEGFDITGSGSSVTVSGAGSSMNARSANIALGASGATGSTLTIEKGGEVRSTNGASMVFAAGTTGTLNITGKDSHLNVSSGFSMARGQGFINITDGGVLDSGLVGIGGVATFSLGGTGTVLISGAGSRWNSGAFHMHSGTASIQDGGLLNVGGVMNISALAGTTASVLVSGAGSGVVTTGNLGVGAAGSGTLSVANGGQVTVNNGTGILNIAASGTGTGRFNIGGETGQAATTAGTLNAARVQFGAGAGVLAFNHTDANYTFGILIAGNGQVRQDGSGTTVLTGANTYSGMTRVSAGTLRAGAANTLSAASAYEVTAGGTLDLAGFKHTIASMANGGTVSLTGSAPGTTLTVNGPWVGSGGTLRLGASLGNGGISDRLILDGATAVASGTTRVQVTNIGGLGALTVGNGIEVISATNGATTTAQTTQDAFSLAASHVDAGAYEYRLFAADATGAGENWYLRSSAIPVVPTPPAAVPAVPAYRAEVPLLAALPAQLRQGDLAMLGNLHQRVGDDEVSASDRGDRRAWGRLISSDVNIRQTGAASPESDGGFDGFQAGTDLWVSPQWRAGVYAGQLNGDLSVKGFASGINGRDVGHNDLRSRSLGLYATWMDDTGLYADAVLQASRHSYTASSTNALNTEGRGKSLLASLELGKAFALGASGWKIEPQVQLVHHSLNLDDVSIPGARVQQDADDGWMLRAGVRVKGEIATALGLVQPYGRFNYYRTSSGQDVSRFVSPAAATGISSAAGGSSAGLAAGATLALNQTASVYGEIGKLWASGGDQRTESGVQGSVGLRLKW